MSSIQQLKREIANLEAIKRKKEEKRRLQNKLFNLKYGHYVKAGERAVKAVRKYAQKQARRQDRHKSRPSRRSYGNDMFGGGYQWGGGLGEGGNLI